MDRIDTNRGRIDSEFKIQAEQILDALELTASEVIELFYEQVILRKGLPFEGRSPQSYNL